MVTSRNVGRFLRLYVAINLVYFYACNEKSSSSGSLQVQMQNTCYRRFYPKVA